MTLCVCRHPSEDHRQFDAGEICLSIGWPMTCNCDGYRRTAPKDRPLSAGVTPEGLAEETVSDDVKMTPPVEESEGVTR